MKTNIETAIKTAADRFTQDLVQILSKYPISELQAFTQENTTTNRRTRNNNTASKKNTNRNRTRKNETPYTDTFTNGDRTVHVRKKGAHYQVDLNGRTYSRLDRHQITSILHRQNYVRFQQPTNA